MKSLDIFLYERKHFLRSPFKVVAVMLFILAAGYGLHNGAGLYSEQMAEVEKIGENIAQERQKFISYFDEGKKGPEDQPWIDLTTPYWSVWNSEVYHFKTPSPALVYSVGQAEQYGFYKRVTFWATPYDSDMTKEIANPERLQIGMLDFSFALLFMLPLLLLVLLYNLKSAEAEQGILPLIVVQTASKNTWLMSRMAYYVGLLFLVVVGLLLYGAILTDVFSLAGAAFGQMLFFSTLYLLFWSVIYFFILRSGKSIMNNTLKMVGIWLVLTFLIPALVHQWISIEKPSNLMTEMIDATRDEANELYELPDSVFQAKLDALFPEIADSPVARDVTRQKFARRRSTAALYNELVKNSTAPIESENNAKNQLVRNTYFFNPITFFQNRFNRISQTHYDDYQNYRNQIQALIEKQIRVMVLDTWEEVEVDKHEFLEYHERLIQP